MVNHWSQDCHPRMERPLVNHLSAMMPHQLNGITGYACHDGTRERDLPGPETSAAVVDNSSVVINFTEMNQQSNEKLNVYCKMNLNFC